MKDTPFERFFREEWRELLDSVKSKRGDTSILSNGTPIQEASWDRKAAYLYFTLREESKEFDFG